MTMRTGSGVVFLLATGVMTACVPVMAADLDSQIAAFFSLHYANSTVQVKTQVITPQEQWPVCVDPQISLPANGRAWGRLSLSVRCAEVRRFVQTEVQVTGNYWVAARSIHSGSALTQADLQQKTGRLDTLPVRVVLNAKQALGAVSLRNINPGQPLTFTMIRRAWVIRAGQNVQVLAQGSGFNASSSGKAMNNAAAEDNVRVRMASGQIVSGVASEDGSIRLML